MRYLLSLCAFFLAAWLGLDGLGGFLSLGSFGSLESLAMAQATQEGASPAQGSGDLLRDLDFDRQGQEGPYLPPGQPQGAAPGAAQGTAQGQGGLAPYVPPAQPTAPADDPDALLQELFTESPATGGLAPQPTQEGAAPAPGLPDGSGQAQADGAQSLAGAPSPLSVPSQPGEAKIEMAPAAAPAQGTAAASSGAGPSLGSSGGQSSRPYGYNERRWYDSAQAWKTSARQNCYSLDPSRPVYHVGCLASVKESGGSRTGLEYVWTPPDRGGDLGPGLRDIRQFP